MKWIDIIKSAYKDKDHKKMLAASERLEEEKERLQNELEAETTIRKHFQQEENRMSDSQIAKKKFEEWDKAALADPKVPDFIPWLELQDKPVDELFEKWVIFYRSEWNDANTSFSKFKEIFAADLNGTKLIDELLEWYGKNPNATTWNYNAKAIQIKQDATTGGK